jgi:hypothetical protein
MSISSTVICNGNNVSAVYRRNHQTPYLLVNTPAAVGPTSSSTTATVTTIPSSEVPLPTRVLTATAVGPVQEVVPPILVAPSVSIAADTLEAAVVPLVHVAGHSREDAPPSLAPSAVSTVVQHRVHGTASLTVATTSASTCRERDKDHLSARVEGHHRLVRSVAAVGSPSSATVVPLGVVQVDVEIVLPLPTLLLL